MKKILRYASVCIVTGLAMIGAIASMPGRGAEAATFSVESCMRSSGTAGSDGKTMVASIQRACQQCAEGSGGVSYGTMWLNNSPNNKSSDEIKVDDPNQTSVNLTLWGQVFACKAKKTSANTAHYIWFADSGQDEGDTRNGKNYLPGKVDFISNNDAKGTLYRGTGIGEANTWFSPMDNRLDSTYTLDINKFKQYVEERVAQGVDGASITEEGGYMVYKAPISVNRCYSKTLGGYYKESNKVCYGDDSTITLRIPPADSAEAMFNSWSYASVKDMNGGDILGGFSTFENGPDSTSEREVSTNEEVVKANFDHQLSYVHPTINGTYGSVSAAWSSKVTIDGVAQSSYNRSGSYSPATSGPAAQDDFSGNDLGRTNVEVTIPAGQSKKVCSTITYSKKYIKWNETSRGSKNFVVNNETSSGTASSTICVTISRGVTVSGGGEFTSRSYVSSSDLGDAGSMSANSSIDGMMDGWSNFQVAEAASKIGNAGFIASNIDIEQSEVSIDFWHKMYYTPPARFFDSSDTAPAVSSNWTVTTQVKKRSAMGEDGSFTETGWSTLGSSPTGTFSSSSGKTAATSSNIPYTVSTNGTVVEAPVHATVALEKGETALVCSTIRYTPKNVTFKVKTDRNGNVIGDIDGDRGHTRDHIRYDYAINQMVNSGSSQACILIYRPIEPQGTPWSGTSGEMGGSALSKIMFAGEATNIGWNIRAQGSSGDNLMEVLKKRQTFNYTSIVNTLYNEDVLRGDKFVTRSESGPCTFVSPLWSNGGQCTVIETVSISGDHDVYNDSALIVSPNEVGSKHGNSAAYFYEISRYEPSCSICGCADDECNSCNSCWIRHPEEDYWYVFNTASRTVAKKPSIAFWNGGVSTGDGSVRTSIASRYTTQSGISYLLTSNGGGITQLGSWTEYLAAVGGTVSGFTSGASLATGLDAMNFVLLNNSPLTIANSNGTVGYSGISSNGILRERLQQYFFNNQTGVQVNIIDVGNTFNGGSYDETTIVRSSGMLKITGDVIASNQNSSTIYDLPQVLIYAPSGVEIDSSVSRIDAWIVTDGVLYTCDDFTSSQTEALVNGYSGNNECSGNLQINGPVFASELIAKRTYGADGISNNDTDTAGGSDTRAATAEVLNLSAMSYLWAYAQGGRYSSSYTEAYSRELPPRY